MRKAGVLLMAGMLMFAVTIPGIFAAEKAKNAAKTAAVQPYLNAPAVNQPKSGGISAAGWILLVGDAALAGLSVYFLMVERSAAESYNTLFDEVNNTTQANYDLLAAKKKEIDDKILVTEIAGAAAAAAVLYTLADVLFIHAAFPSSTKVSYDPGSKAVKLSVSRGF